MSKTRTVFLPAPSRARPRFFPAARPRTAPAPAVSKTRTVSFSSPRLARTRLFPAARLRAAPVFPGGEKAPARPPRTETLEKLSSAPWLFKRFPVSRRFAARRAVKPASSAGKGEIGRRAQEWGFEGAAPLANLCLLSFRKKVEARRGLSDK